MLLVITPLTGWHRRIRVYSFVDGTEAQWFEAFQKVNEMYDSAGERGSVNIALVPISVSQLETWLENNVEPTWWESLWGRYRIEVTRLMREA